MRESAQPAEPTSTLEGVDGLIRPALVAKLLPFLSEAVCVYDRDGHMTARIAPPGGLLGFGDQVGSSSALRYHPDDLPTSMAINTALVAETEPGWHGRWRTRLGRADGTWGSYEIRLTNCCDDPDIDGFVACVRELDAVVGHDPPVQVLHDELAGSLVESLPTAHLVLSRSGRVLLANAAARTLLGVTELEILDADVTDLAGTDEQAALKGCVADLADELGERVAVFTSDGIGDSGAVIEARFVAQGRPDRTALIHASLSDVSADHGLVRLAMSDPLTGVANRTRVVETLAGLVHLGVGVTVLFADLDGFKAVNDARGHQAGDDVLVAVAEALTRSARSADLVGRLGGDEFVVVCPGLRSDAEARALADRVVDEVHRAVGGGPTPVRISIGWASAHPGESARDVLGRADAAMFAAKRRARNASTDPSGSAPG